MISSINREGNGLEKKKKKFLSCSSGSRGRGRERERNCEGQEEPALFSYVQSAPLWTLGWHSIILFGFSFCFCFFLDLTMKRAVKQWVPFCFMSWEMDRLMDDGAVCHLHHESGLLGGSSGLLYLPTSVAAVMFHCDRGLSSAASTSPPLSLWWWMRSEMVEEKFTLLVAARFVTRACVTVACVRSTLSCYVSQVPMNHFLLQFKPISYRFAFFFNFLFLLEKKARIISGLIPCNFINGNFHVLICIGCNGFDNISMNTVQRKAGWEYFREQQNWTRVTKKIEEENS